MIAAHRNAQGNNIIDPSPGHAVLPPAAPLIDFYAAKASPVREIVLGNAGSLTCSASCAEGCVDEKSVLLAQSLLPKAPASKAAAAVAFFFRRQPQWLDIARKSLARR